MPPPARPEVLVIGASLAGLFAAAAAAATGAHVTLLERDRLPAEPAPRPGVPQGWHSHVLLHRGHLAAESLLPGLTEDILAAGAVRFDTGAMPWCGEYGWGRTDLAAYEVLSLTRPLLEHLVRRRVLALHGVTLRAGTRVTGLARYGRGWSVQLAEGTSLPAEVVIDASGRSSRLPRWLADLGLPVRPPTTVDARLGYATRVYRPVRPVPLETAVTIVATPESARGALALPVEGQRWLIGAAGYGDARPPRGAEEFTWFLRSLRDPAVSDLLGWLEPESDPILHRQTGNRRHFYGRDPRWPDGLLAVGDSLCAFNPAYGQGIAVAASQGELLRSELARLQAPGRTRRLQRRLSAVVDVPWSVSTGQDLRQPSCDRQPTRSERVAIAWSERLSKLIAGGDPHAFRAFSEVYHLMAPPRMLLAPVLVRSVLRAELRGYPASVARPAVLAALSSAPVR